MSMSGSKQKVIANVRVGKAQTRPAAPSHTPGVRQGNARGNFQREHGIEPMPDGGRATELHSTGINPKAHVAIDPRMPNLPPA